MNTQTSGLPQAESSNHLRSLDAQEASYMTGGAEPVLSSVLISNSKYLNNPLFRETFAQFALRRDGHDLPYTYLVPQMIRAINDVKDYGEFFGLIESEKIKNPDFASWLDARRITSFKPDMLRACGSGTLGEQIRLFIEHSGMNIEFMLQDEVITDFDYITKRRVMHHDIEHMVTGFGPNPLGEQALSIVHVAANARYFSPELAHHMSETYVFVSSTAYQKASLHYPTAMAEMMECMRLGIEAGQALERPLFMVDWEDYLEWKIPDIRAHLGIGQGPGDSWDDSAIRMTG